MAKTSAAVRAKRMFKTIPAGTPVTWPYRGTHGWGDVAGVASKGTTPDDTRYNVRQVDNHVSSTGSHERKLVVHTGRALRRSTAAAVAAAAKRAKTRAKKG